MIEKKKKSKSTHTYCVLEVTVKGTEHSSCRTHTTFFGITWSPNLGLV
jgi:hypothetical protein